MKETTIEGLGVLYLFVCCISLAGAATISTMLSLNALIYKGFFSRVGAYSLLFAAISLYLYAQIILVDNYLE
jgi:hypothetical protein